MRGLPGAGGACGALGKPLSLTRLAQPSSGAAARDVHQARMPSGLGGCKQFESAPGLPTFDFGHSPPPAPEVGAAGYPQPGKRRR
jgi:hypothetical protein